MALRLRRPLDQRLADAEHPEQRTIGLRDRDIDELFDGYAEVGTTVRIYAREPISPTTPGP